MVGAACMPAGSSCRARAAQPLAVIAGGAVMTARECMTCGIPMHGQHLPSPCLMNTAFPLNSLPAV